MHDDPILYPTDQAHWKALDKIDPAEREIGRLACWDYAINFYESLGANLPDTPTKLLDLLDNCATIAESPYEHALLKALFEDNNCPMPTGMEDLPVFWSPGIRCYIEEFLWADKNPESLREFFDWSTVMRQGAFLDIHFGKAIPTDDWPTRASLILGLHQFLEPGGLTSPLRLTEFI